MFKCGYRVSRRFYFAYTSHHGIVKNTIGLEGMELPMKEMMMGHGNDLEPSARDGGRGIGNFSRNGGVTNQKYTTGPCCSSSRIPHWTRGGIIDYGQNQASVIYHILCARSGKSVWK